MNTTRAMYSSTEIDRMQSEERNAYLKSLEAQGKTLWNGKIVDIDDIADLEIAQMESRLDAVLDSIEEGC